MTLDFTNKSKKPWTKVDKTIAFMTDFKFISGKQIFRVTK